MHCYISLGPTHYPIPRSLRQAASSSPDPGSVSSCSSHNARPWQLQAVPVPSCLLQYDLSLTPALLFLGPGGPLQERGQRCTQASLQPQEMASFCLSCFQPWLALQQPVSSPGLLTAPLPVQVCFEFTAHLQIKAGRDIQGLRAQTAPPHPAARYPLSWRARAPLWRQGVWDLAQGSPSTMEPEVGRWGRLWSNHWHQPLLRSLSRTRTVNSSGVISWAQALVA